MPKRLKRSSSKVAVGVTVLVIGSRERLSHSSKNLIQKTWVY